MAKSRQKEETKTTEAAAIVEVKKPAAAVKRKKVQPVKDTQGIGEIQSVPPPIHRSERADEIHAPFTAPCGSHPPDILIEEEGAGGMSIVVDNVVAFNKLCDMLNTETCKINGIVIDSVRQSLLITNDILKNNLTSLLRNFFIDK
ncbi:MAG: hypothetical protein HQL03_02300 [Nitrospirae bacterium]|nr:hypothetical protein [Nitrospirota bacterium]